MPAEDRALLEMVIGVVMTQSAILDFLIKNNVIESAPLIEHLLGKRLSWEKAASQNALFPVDTLMNLLAGRHPPKPPGPLN